MANQEDIQLAENFASCEMTNLLSNYDYFHKICKLDKETGDIVNIFSNEIVDNNYQDTLESFVPKQYIDKYKKTKN